MSEEERTFAELNPPYSTIVADPPWPIRWSGGLGGRRANRTELVYSVMTVDDIKKMAVSVLSASVCSLWLWTTAELNRTGVGVAVAESWGFRVTGEIVWDKPNLGMGAVPRICHEVLLVAVKGTGAVDGPRDIRSVQRWPQVYGNGKTHSAKPAAAYDLIETCSPGPYLELFARQPRLGWDAWGHGYELSDPLQ